MGVLVPPRHGPRHVQTEPARVLGVHHLGVQHHHLVTARFGTTARYFQLQLGNSDTDLPVILTRAVSPELVEPQLGGVDPDLPVLPLGGELDFVELGGDVLDIWQLGQQLLAVVT